MVLNIKNNLIFAIVLMTLATPLAWTKAERYVFSSETDKQILKRTKSSDIKVYMNTDIDPCNDFYSYSCGKWKNIYPPKTINNVWTSFDKFSELSKATEQKFNQLLNLKKTGNQTIEKKIIDFYESCRNTKTDNNQYRLALQNVYKEFGEFSFLKTKEQLNKTDFQWWSAVAKIQNIYGKSIILAVNVLGDIKNNTRTMLYLASPKFDKTKSAEEIKVYLKLVFCIDDEDASKVANEISQFQYSISQGVTDVRDGKSNEELSTLYNTTDLKETYQYLFDTDKFLEIVLGNKDLPEQVYVFDESYVQNLIDVFNATNERIVENYILWSLLQEYIVDAKDLELNKVCAHKSQIYFGKFVNHFIYNQYRTKEVEDEVYELWDDIKDQFHHNLNSDIYYWMSNDTREQAIIKLNNMNLTINSYDNENFIQFYKNLDIDSKNYVVNLQNLFKHGEALRENKLHKKPESIQGTQLASFTPFYDIFKNEIKIPNAMLQPHYILDPNYPKAVKYATLGYLIAHEMIHGFDKEGRKYDADGNARSWWDEKSSNEFELRRKCFQAQYHNYTYEGQRLPDSLLQSENIADNAGLKLAYSAYERWLAKQKEVASNVETSETLPDLIYNNRKLFFISFAQVWCENTHPDVVLYNLDRDNHAPAMYRVIGSLSNFDKFAEIWNCKNESRMVSPNKCEIY